MDTSIDDLADKRENLEHGEAMVNSKRKMISIIIPVYNEESVLSSLFQRLVDVINSLKDNYDVRVILIDDGSRDDSWKMIQNISSDDPRFSGIRLSRNFGHQAALSCGYQFAQGNAVITMDADLQDPPELIPNLIRQWEQGNRVVLAVRRTREGESKFKLTTARAFYKVMARMSDTQMPEESGDFRLMDRAAADTLKDLTETHRYIRGLVGWLGFKTGIVEYDRPPRRAGNTKYSLLKMIGLALDAIVSFSFMPLRVAYLAAFVLMLPFLGYLIYNFFLYFLFNKEMVPGWSSLILATILFGAFNLIMLGVLGEYIGRIYSEVKRRPLFVIDECCGQNAMANFNEAVLPIRGSKPRAKDSGP